MRVDFQWKEWNLHGNPKMYRKFYFKKMINESYVLQNIKYNVTLQWINSWSRHFLFKAFRFLQIYIKTYFIQNQNWGKIWILDKILIHAKSEFAQKLNFTQNLNECNFCGSSSYTTWQQITLKLFMMFMKQFQLSVFLFLKWGVSLWKHTEGRGHGCGRKMGRGLTRWLRRTEGRSWDSMFFLIYGYKLLKLRVNL